MNKRYRKILATGLALNMMLINIPYNVFANSDAIENVILNEENVHLIGEQSKSDLVIKDEQTSSNEDLIEESEESEESDSNYINNEIVSEFSQPVIEGESSSLTEINASENILNSTTDFTENKKSSKSSIPSVVNYADSFAGGNGSEENPYQISNALELARLAYLINEEDLDTTGMYFELTNDIDLNNFDSDDDDVNGNWIPIGYTTSGPDYLQVGFKGVFDGGGHTISNITIINVEDSFITSCGIFAYVDNVEIKNLNIENISINSRVYNNGVLIAYGDNEIVLNNINIKNINFVSEHKSSFVFGALVGYLYGNTIVSNIDVNFENKIELNKEISSYIGGLIGGLYSYNTDTINSFDNLKIEGSSDCARYLGFVIGNCSSSTKEINFKNIEANFNVSIINEDVYIGTVSYLSGNSSVCFDDINLNFSLKPIYKDSQISAFVVGGLIAFNSSSGGMCVNNININIDNLIDSISYYGGLFGFYSFGSSFLIKNVYIKIENIENVESNYKFDITSFFWGGIAGMLSSSNLEAEIDNFNMEIVNNINVSDFQYSLYIGGVYGFNSSNLNLKNSKISFNVNLLNTNYSYLGGLIGYNNAGNIYIENVCVSNNFKQEVGAGSNVGGFVGSYYGNNITIKNSGHQGELNGYYVGGIVGSSNVINSINIENFYSLGNKFGEKRVGGFVGGSSYGADIIEIADLNLSNIYIAGNINGENYKTDLICPKYSVDNISTENLFYDKDFYQVEENVPYFTGLTTEQMQGLNAKDNMPFDYDNAWKLNKEYYPTFEQLNTAPELSGNDIELIQNQEYNLLDYITVEDFEDKDLIPEIETNLDIAKIGNYTATFTVADPGGLSDELTLKIKVVAERPIINAKDLTLYVGDKFNPLDKVTAIDINGNDITKHIKVIENTVDTTKKGVYKVVYQVDSLERLSTTKEIKVTVLEKAK